MTLGHDNRDTYDDGVSGRATPFSTCLAIGWDSEDAFKIGKHCLGWEDVPVLTPAVRRLVALGWVAAGFLYELGVTLEWAEVRLLTRLGGGRCAARSGGAARSQSAERM